MSAQTTTRRRRSRPKAVLLDLGGIVIDIDPHACFASWARAADVNAGVIAARWAVDDAYKAFETGAIDFDEYLANLAGRLGIVLTREQWRSGWNALLRAPFEGVARILPEVAAVMPLYGFSNTNTVHQEAWQSRFVVELAPFRRIYTSWEIGLRKPAVEAYLKVADAMAIAPPDILFIDDNRENVLGARSAGLDARHVTDPDDTVAILRDVVGRS